MSTSSDGIPMDELAMLSVSPMEGPMTGKVGGVPSSSPNGEPCTAGETAAEALDHEADIGSAIYPPVLEEMEVLGYIEDKNGIRYSRDIGRSAVIHHEVYFIFGDTFFEDAAGNPVGITSNTVAYVEDRAKLLESEYREVLKDGKVKAFVPLNEKEVRFEEQNKKARIVFRMLGGTVDIGTLGVVWFQKLVKHENGDEEYRGIGQARLTTYSDGKILVQRRPRLLFGPNKPKMGSFSTLFHEGHVYLWGDRSDGQIILARVDRYKTAFSDQYEYWSGRDWVPRWHDAVPVLHDVQHGAIVHTNLFGNKSFLFVGVSRQANSMVQIGAATKIQGPFDLVAVCKAKGMDDNKESKDCTYSHIYPHLWASNVPKRELIVTWSESPPGGVLVAKLKFKIDEVAAVKEAKERKIAAEEREARRLASIGGEREEAMDHFGYESDESDDPRPKRDRSEGRLKNGYVLTIPRTSSDPPTEP